MELFSFGGYGLALAALALVVFGAYDSYPINRAFAGSFLMGDLKKVDLLVSYRVVYIPQYSRIARLHCDEMARLIGYARWSGSVLEEAGGCMAPQR